MTTTHAIPPDTDSDDFGDVGPTDPPRCVSCGDTFHSRGPVVCPACVDAGVCSVCAGDHRAYRCPEISAMWPRPRTARALLAAVCPDCGAPMIAGLPRCAACRQRVVEVFDRDNARLLAPRHRKALVQ